MSSSLDLSKNHNTIPLNPEAPKLWLISWSGAAVDTGIKSGNCGSPISTPFWLFTIFLGDLSGNVVETKIGDEFGNLVEVQIEVGLFGEMVDTNVGLGVVLITE